jgi:hypothetical protein
MRENGRVVGGEEWQEKESNRQELINVKNIS